MGRPKGWGSELTGRPVMRSPSRPPVGRREHRRRFWAAIARGMTSERAGVEAGVSPAVGVRWFRLGGGMPSVTQAPLSGRYLSFEEREEIALLRAQGHGVREIARQLGRSPLTISRELRRTAATRGGRLDYRVSTAQWHADRSARRPKPAKLAGNAPLREYVQDRLSRLVERPGGSVVAGPAVRWVGRRHGRRKDRRWGKAWSPEQISHRLRVDFPDDESMRVSHEAIYQSLFVQGRGALRRELTACLRTGEQLRRSLTWDQGAEMAQHARLRVQAGLPVYFCDPQSPWQRGSNENTNGLLRQYFPRGTDLARHDAEDLAAVAAALNGRPRKTLSWRTPAEALNEYLSTTS